MTDKILVVDDHTIFRRAVSKVLSGLEDVEVIGEAATGDEALAFLEESSCTPSLILLDISMPGMHWIKCTKKLKVVCPGVNILILTIHDEPEYFYTALGLGVQGYVLKSDSDDDLVEAIKVVQQGGLYISPGMIKYGAKLFIGPKQ